MREDMLQPDIETMSRDQLAGLQLARLKEIARYVYKRNAAWRNRFAEAGVTPEDIRELSDLRKLPMLDKEGLRLAYPDALLCEDRQSIRELHMSSGSSGTPIAMLYNQDDLDQWAECMARCYRMAGCRPGDPVQITPSFGLFNGGFGMYHGARRAGLFVIPTGAGNTARQIKLARDFHTRIFTGVVSYGVRVIEELEKSGFDLPDLAVGIFGAETFSDSMKRRISEGLGVEAFDIYGMTETGGVGTPR